MNPQEQNPIPSPTPIAPPPVTPQPAIPPKSHRWLKFVVLGVVLLVVAVVAVVLFVVYSPNANSWRDKYKAQFQAAGQKVTDDITTVSSDVLNQDAVALPDDCRQLKTDIASLQAIPAFPVKTTNDKLVAAEQSIAQGADDCIAGTSQQSATLINKAGEEFQSGMKALEAVIPLVNG